MFTYETVLAAALLTTGPVELPEELVCWRVVVAEPLKSLSFQEEILDRREADHILQSRPVFAGDVRLLQGRFAELRHAPYLEECRRFPDRKLVNEFLNFNRAYRQDLVARMAIDKVHAEELRFVLAEVDALYQVWDTVRDARCEFYYDTVRRQALDLLRRLIGDEAFYSGRLPPHVPVWSITRVR